MIKAVKEERNNLNLLRNGTGKFPPILVKIAPDMTESQFEVTVSALIDLRVDGIILSNTTVTRPESLKSEGKIVINFDFFM